MPSQRKPLRKAPMRGKQCSSAPAHNAARSSQTRRESRRERGFPAIRTTPNSSEKSTDVSEEFLGTPALPAETIVVEAPRPIPPRQISLSEISTTKSSQYIPRQKPPSVDASRR